MTWDGDGNAPSSELCFEPAVVGEGPLLTELALRSKAHWPYSGEELASYRTALTVDDTTIRKETVVHITRKGERIGFYSLARVAGENRLDNFWLERSAIGKGYGRIAFAHIRDAAIMRGWTSFRIVTDDFAKGFYEKMGAIHIGSVDSKLGPGITLVHMECTLT